jgi:hypothetical protein
MTIDELRQSLSSEAPPDGIAPAVIALWHDARGNWDEAHRVAQDVPDGQGGAWVHAYLHRKEGDADNAAYWYRRAAQPIARDALHQEWERIAAALLAKA